MNSNTCNKRLLGNVTIKVFQPKLLQRRSAQNHRKRYAEAVADIAVAATVQMRQVPHRATCCVVGQRRQARACAKDNLKDE